jgi:DNA-binding beta-propeller fold protein YncE
MRRALLLASVAVLAALAVAPSAALGSPDPLVFTPKPPPGPHPPPEPGEPPPPPPKPPPVGSFEGPCGLAVDTSGDFYVADYYHDVIDHYILDIDIVIQKVEFKYIEQIAGVAADNGPCGLAVDNETGQYLVNERHGAVLGFSSAIGADRIVLDPGPASGVAIGPGDGFTYVDDFDHVSVYAPNGTPVEVSGQPLRIGAGSLGAGYGIAVSGYPATKDFVYVPDATSNTVKVYDPATDTENPVQELDRRFTSLRDSAVAVDDSSGEVYIVDNLQPGTTDSPEAVIQIFAADGSYEGRLKYNIIDARPPGLAVDNSGISQGRVYVTTGNTALASLMVYPAHSAGSEARAAIPNEPFLPPGQGAEAPLPEPPPPVTCVNDSCQELSSQPRDLPLATLLDAPGNGPVRFFDTNRVSRVLKLRGHHRHRRGARRRKGAGRRTWSGGTGRDGHRQHPRLLARPLLAASPRQRGEVGDREVRAAHRPQ